jgi:RHS repeat-associated protein
VYVYDYSGTRVAKQSGSANSVSNSDTNEYLQGPGGEQLAEFNGSGNLLHANIFGGGRLWATVSGGQLSYHTTDWLGTRRLQSNASGQATLSCTSLPFGDNLYCNGTGSDTTEHHFTGKERDSESGNDYFGARYYASTMGRFMSPDPLMMNALRLVNPQRLNMYAYAVNNPLTFNDPTGLDAATVTFTTEVGGLGHDGLLSVHSDGSVTFAEFGPRGGNRPWGVGNVHTLSSSNGQLPTLKFDGNRYPTQQSLSALKNKLAQSESVNPNSIKIAYFKTSASETAALDEYIATWVAAAKTGKLRYLVIGPNCAWFCQNGLKAAGQPGFQGHLPIPNVLALQWWWASGQGTEQKPLREKVTHKICDANGNNCH